MSKRWYTRNWKPTLAACAAGAVTLIATNASAQHAGTPE
jgi:hypothetical protein